jgi:mono/diheme cytochrome c family protein
MKNLSHYNLLILLVIILLGVAACKDYTRVTATAPVVPTNTPAVEINVAEPDLIRGQQVWLDKQCVACHGEVGQGGVGGEVAGITKPFDEFLHILRTALPPKPAYNRAELPDQDAYNVYAWLQSIGTEADVEPVATPNLPEGEVLGMTLWTQYECDQCHGAFAQGSAAAPPLAEISYPYERERAVMRQTETEIPQHAAEYIRDVVLKRLYNWLQAGANPNDGC